MSNEEILSDFLARHYTDENLCQGLAHAEAGRLSYFSCCCYIGIPTADHALRGYAEYGKFDDGSFEEDHYARSLALDGAELAEQAYHDLAHDRNDSMAEDAERRYKIIPLIRAEISRRDGARSESLEAVELVTA